MAEGRGKASASAKSGSSTWSSAGSIAKSSARTSVKTIEEKSAKSSAKSCARVDTVTGAQNSEETIAKIDDMRSKFPDDDEYIYIIDGV